MKKIILGAALLFLSCFARSQNGLEGIIVEKYYVSTAADTVGTFANGSGTLPIGSVTYRIYADMLPGYEFQALYGVPTHSLVISSSQPFFNNSDRGNTKPESFTKAQAANNTVMLDSWFSVGGAASDALGVLKSEDDGVANVTNLDGLLQNNSPVLGIPLTTQDGFKTGTPEAVTFVGLDSVGYTPVATNFGTVSLSGSLFTTSNGSIASFNGSVGPTASNRVLIGQFTTAGTFKFELNVQIGTPGGGTQNYVASNPVGGEISIPSLTLDCSAPITPVTSISGSTEVCINSNPVFTAAPSLFGYVYSWSVSNTTMQINSGNGTSAITTGFSAGFTAATLSVSASTVCGTSSVTIAALTKNANIKPVLTGSITTTQANICPINGTTTQVTYTIPAVPDAGTYTWTFPATLNLVSGQGTNTLVVNYAGTYLTGDIKVKAVSECGGTLAQYSAEKKLTPTKGKLAVPGTLIVAGPAGALPVNVCAYVNHGEQVTFSIPSAIPDANSYTWSIPANTSIVGPATGTSIKLTFNALFAGGEVKAAAVNGCGTGAFSKGVKIANPKLPVTPLLMTGPHYLCGYASPGGTGATFSIPPVSAANSYTWNVPTGMAIVGPATGTSVTYTFTTTSPNATDLISVSAVSGCGNSAVPRTYTVSRGIETPAKTSVSGFNLVCPGTTTNYSVPAVPNATAYNWSVIGSTTLTVVSPSANSANIAWGTKGGKVSVTVDGCGVTGVALAKPFEVKTGKCRLGVFVTDAMLSAYPNPSQAESSVTIALSGLVDMDGVTATIVMYNMLGQPVYSSQKGYNENDGLEDVISTQGIAPGMYMITVTIGEEVYNQKLMLTAH